jgi:hypothetical protein
MQPVKKACIRIDCAEGATLEIGATEFSFMSWSKLTEGKDQFYCWNYQMKHNNYLTRKAMLWKVICDVELSWTLSERT